MTDFEYIVREAKVSDAKALNAYMRRMFAEADYLITEPSEFTMGPFRHRLWLARKLGSKNQTWILALKGREVIGMIDNWNDNRNRLKHVTNFGITVDAAYQGHGVGRALLTKFLEWADANQTIKKIHLGVAIENEGAIKLYKNMGFIVEGCQEKASLRADGSCGDDIIMGKWIG